MSTTKVNRAIRKAARRAAREFRPPRRYLLISHSVLFRLVDMAMDHYDRVGRNKPYGAWDRKAIDKARAIMRDSPR